MPGPGAYLIGKEEIKEVMEVMESGHLMRYGDLSDPAFKRKVYTLEKEFADYCGVPYALATSSGTGSLWLSLLAMGIEPGDEVIVPAYTFVATYSAVLFAGAVPVLTEINESLTLDPENIERRITPKTRAIIAVHMLGNPCDMDAIMDIANMHGLMVLEDACQAAGASYKGRKIGSIGHMGAFSLNIFKTITAGDGGLFVTKDKELYERVFALHDQGHSPLRGGVDVGRRNILGMNFRVNELLGAVALAQLRKIDKITSTLRAKKSKLKEMIGDIDGFKFRTLNDTSGECGTLLTVIFDSKDMADKVSKALSSTTADHSGWHVYFNMEHVVKRLCELGRPIGKGCYPKTDDILSRAMNISIGVVDAGLGAGFGININSTDKEIRSIARRFWQACQEARCF
ncbi:MAG: DegT/DnrJ/EryC1/StrS family aminotransferase [Planctomycetota bacterium]